MPRQKKHFIPASKVDAWFWKIIHANWTEDAIQFWMNED